MSWPALAIEPFVIKDIRVEGVQRTEPGTVFTYLPVKVGEKIDDDKAAEAIRALYATGFYSDVRLEADGDVLVVSVRERPAIATIQIDGATEYTPEILKGGLKEAGISESKVFDKSIVDRAEKELKRQYTGIGHYGVNVKTTVTPLERNRVALRFEINEGEVTRIADINFIGNKDFTQKELLREMKLRTPGWFTWFTKSDQYSKQQITADLEALRSFYLNRGYLEFNIDATQVSITPDHDSIYIDITMTEGAVYHVGELKFSGDLIIGEPAIRKLLTFKTGDIFSREKIVQSTKKITDALGNEGYSFAAVNTLPALDAAKRIASFSFAVDPGRRVYVRRINITGNQKTQDQVIRRELRQLEGSWYSLEKIARSKERLQRTGYFTEVNVDTPAVPGTADQVDVNVTVVERNTGTLNFGIGYSPLEKFQIQASVSQSNFMGSGNLLQMLVSTGAVNKDVSFTFQDPYWTSDGISRAIDIYQRDVDTSALLGLANYSTYTTGAGMRFGIPVSEYDTVSAGLALERTRLTIDPTVPQRYIDFVNEFGERTVTLRTNWAYGHDTRDSIIYPTRGTYNEISAEFGIPPGDLTYYRANYLSEGFYTPSWLSWLTMMAKAQIGYANGYHGHPLPFFKNFYAGGVDSVRGFQTATLGPRDTNGDILGGNRSFVANLEALFPIPGYREKNVRLSQFVDFGDVWGPDERIRAIDLRVSAGLAVNWDSPMGPLRFSVGIPLKKRPDDKIERFQFQLGRSF